MRTQAFRRLSRRRGLGAAAAAALLLLTLAAAATSCGSDAQVSTDTFLTASGLPTDAVTVVDLEGDVTDVDGGRPPEDSQAADLLQAAVHLTDEGLIFALQQNTPPPSSLPAWDYGAGLGESLVYTLFIAPPEGEIIYMPQIHLKEAEWVAYIYDRATGETLELEVTPKVEGDVISCTFPRDLLPDLASPFRWAAGSEWSWSTGHESGDRVAFGDQVTEDDSDGWTGYPYEWAEYR